MVDINTNPNQPPKKKKSDFWDKVAKKSEKKANEAKASDPHTGAGDAFSRAQQARQAMHEERAQPSSISKNVLRDKPRFSALGKYSQRAGRAVKKAATTTAPAVSSIQQAAREDSKKTTEAVMPGIQSQWQKTAGAVGDSGPTVLFEKITNNLQDEARKRLDSLKGSKQTLINESSQLQAEVQKINPEILKAAGQTAVLQNLAPQKISEVAAEISKSNPAVAQDLSNFNAERQRYADHLLTVKSLQEAAINPEQNFSAALAVLRQAGVSENNLNNLAAPLENIGVGLKSGQDLAGLYSRHASAEADSVYLWPETLAGRLSARPEFKSAYQNYQSKVLAYDGEQFLRDKAPAAEVSLLVQAEQQTLWHEVLGHGLTSAPYRKSVSTFLRQQPEDDRKKLSGLAQFVSEGSAETIVHKVSEGLNQPRGSETSEYKISATPYFMLAAAAASPSGKIPYDQLLKVDDEGETPFLRDKILPQLAPVWLNFQDEIKANVKKYQDLREATVTAQQVQDQEKLNNLRQDLKVFNEAQSGPDGLWHRFATALSPERGDELYQQVLDDLGEVQINEELFSDLLPILRGPDISKKKMSGLLTDITRVKDTAIGQKIVQPKMSGLAPRESAREAEKTIAEIIEPKAVSEAELKNQLAGAVRAEQFDAEKALGLHEPPLQPTASAGARPLAKDVGQPLTNLTVRAAAKPAAPVGQKTTETNEARLPGLGLAILNRASPGWQDKIGSQLKAVSGGLVSGEDLDFAMDMILDNMDRTIFNPGTLLTMTIMTFGIWPIMVLGFMLFFRLPHGFEFGLDKQKLKMMAKWGTIIATAGAGAGVAAGAAEAGSTGAALKGAQTAGTITQKGGLSSVGTSSAFTREVASKEASSMERKIVDELQSQRQQDQQAQPATPNQGGSNPIIGLIWKFFQRKYRWSVSEPIISTGLAFLIVMIEAAVIALLYILFSALADIASGMVETNGIFGFAQGIVSAIVKGIGYLEMLGAPLVNLLKEIVKGII